jgi:hypothetical protein
MMSSTRKAAIAAIVALLAITCECNAPAAPCGCGARHAAGP